MLNPRSIRFRLTLWYAAILFVALGVFSGLLWFSLRARLTAEVTRELTERAEHFQNFFLAELSGGAKEGVEDELQEFCQALPAGSYVKLTGRTGFSFHYPVSETSTPRDSIRIERLFDTPTGSFAVEMSTPASEIAHTMDLLRMLLLGLTPAVIVIACIGGMWLSRRALRPVEEMTRAAHAISIENLTERLPATATGDELARLTDVLNSMLGRIETAVRTLSQFAADASHELRTPLAVIQTTSELALRRDRSPESYRESLKAVVSESERMTRLIEDLLILARTGTTALEMPAVALDAGALLAGVCDEMRTLTTQRAVRIDCNVAREQFVILGNQAALHRLFLALMDNAVKFSPDAAVVRVEAEMGNDGLAISVQDHGRGISGVDLPHIFERFYRAAHGGEAGYGLGLSLADMIARAHGAAIDVQSSPGQGSTFRVTFPAHKVAAPSENPHIDWISYKPAEQKELHP